MAGYWKIDKDWVQVWGLTATECIVLADCETWQGTDGQGCTIDERAERCGLSRAGVRKVMASLQKKLQKVPQSSTQSCHFRCHKVAPKVLQSSTKGCYKVAQKVPQSSTSPHTPYNKEEEHEEKTKKGGSAHARVSTPPDTHDEGQEAAQRLADNESRHRILSAGIMRGWVAHWEQELGFQPHITHSVTSEVNDLEPTIARLMVADGYVIDEDTVAAYTQQLFSAMRQKADDWQRAKWSLAVINKQFDTFIDRLKNGTTTTANNPRRYTGTLAAMRDEIAADIAAGK